MTFGGRTDDDVARMLLFQICLGLVRIVVVEIGMFDDPPCLLVFSSCLAQLHLLIAVLLSVVPCFVMFDLSELAITCPNIAAGG